MSAPFLRGWWALSLALAAAPLAPQAAAQPIDQPIEPATTNKFPPGVSVRETPDGAVYVDARGLTLYGMDFRMLGGRTGEPAGYCRDACARTWEPLAAPPGAKVAPLSDPLRLRGGPGRGSRLPPADWTVIEGADGPQWLYKQWHLVFTRRGDAPSSVEWDGSDDWVWNTLKYIPPAPDMPMPPQVSTRYVDGAYAFATRQGALLYRRDCGRAGCGSDTPLRSGLAMQGLGEWQVTRDGDGARWRYRGQPVYVAKSADPASLPNGATLLRP